MRWFARHFLDKAVWQPSRHSFAGGLAVGMFAMGLLMPGQIGLAIILAALFRVNIPIAAAACWISNPFTFVPFVWGQVVLGNWLTELLGMGTPPPLEWAQLTSMVSDTPGIWELLCSLRPWAFSVYLGGVASGLVLAVISYVLSFALWDLVMAIVRHRKTANARLANTL